MRTARIGALAVFTFLGSAAALAGTSMAVLGVGAVVQRSAIVKSQEIFQQLNLGPANAQGYVDVPGTFRLVVNPGTSSQRVVNVMVEVEPDPRLFRAIHIDTATDPAASSSAPGDADPASFIMGYRVMLTDEARSRPFTVPVTLSINL